jgi:glycosyltransferase involved in cell wall biosynthesis
LRILYCSNAFPPADREGGPPFSSFHLATALVDAGAEVRVVTTDRNGSHRLDVPTDRWREFQGLPVWYARTWRGPWVYGPTLSRVINEEVARADCVISASTLWTYTGYCIWSACGKSGKPSLLYLRNLLSPWALGYRGLRKRLHWNLLGRRILASADAVVALSGQEREDIRRMGVRARIEVIPNGAIAPDASPALTRERLSRYLPVLDGRRYVLFLGRLHPIKGLDLLLAAIERLSVEFPDVAFVLAGPADRSFASKMKAILDQHDPTRRVVLPGTVSGEAKTLLLKFAHAFVLPSYSEGLPVAVLEALASGCPVVITKQCNLPEVAVAGAGIEINPDQSELAAAIGRLLLDTGLRQAMASNALRLAKEKFDWGVIGTRVLSLCQEIVIVASGRR